MINISKLLHFIFLLFLLISCKEEEPVIVEVPIPTPDIAKVNIAGYVQKGPFINGTSITIVELNDSLGATGKTFISQVMDNKGSFLKENIELTSHYVELMAYGFYFDEVKGEKSIAPLAMYALSNVSDISSVNVNILSHLEKDRVMYLIQEEEKSFVDAKEQAQQEILAIFGIVKEDIASAELLDISKEGEDNAILLAISAMLQADNTVAELSELLANIITDIREDGKLDDQIVKEKLVKQSISLQLPEIRTHLEKRYEELKVNATIANFEKYVDSDGDGILNKEEDDTPDEFTFTTKKDVAINTEITSDEITIAGLKEGGVSDIQVSHASLFVNGNLVQDSLAQVKNGDKIKLQLTSSSQYADTVVASLSIGYLTNYFTVITDDYKADSISFTAQKDVAVDSFYISNTITVSGLPHSTPARIEDGILMKNGVELSADTTSVKNGDQLAVKLMSSNQYFTTTSAKLDINGIATTFAITTDDYKPDDFNFIPVENAKRDSTYTSNTVTLTGLPHPTPISIDQGTLVVNGKEVPGTETTVKNGDQVAVKLGASTDYETKINSFVKIGALSYEFSIITPLNPWQRKADFALSMPGRFTINPGRFTINDVIYIVDDSMNIYQYSSSKDQWIYKTKFPGKYRSSFIVFAIGNKAYIGSGNNNTYSSNSMRWFYENKPERDFWEYTPSTNQWTRKTDFPGENIAYATSFTINNKGYVTTGYYDDPNYDYEGNYYEDHIYSRQLWEYDPLSDQWSRKADFPGQTRRSAASVGFNGKGYLGGGNKGVEGNTIYDFWIYDPVTNSWVEKADFTEQLPLDFYGYGACSFFSINDRLYFMTTWRETIFKKYDAILDLWKDEELPKDSKDWSYGIGIIAGGQKAYLYANQYEKASQAWEFTPPSE